MPSFGCVSHTIYSVQSSLAIWSGHKGKKTVARNREVTEDIEGAEQRQLLTKYLSRLSACSAFSRPDYKKIECGKQQQEVVEINILIHLNVAPGCLSTPCQIVWTHVGVWKNDIAAALGMY